MKYKVIIIDLDNTLIDFDRMEVGSLTMSFDEFGIKWTKEMVDDYIDINNGLWAQLEKGNYSKEEILVLRFKELFRRYDIHIEASAMNKKYLSNMRYHVHLYDHAIEILESIQDATVVCMTNGVKSAQEAKFDEAKLYPYFDHIIISDEVGVHKPNVGIFEYMRQLVGDVSKEEMIIVGDSLTSDIKGGNNFGIKTVWFNPKGKSKFKGVHVDYEIKRLIELKEIL
jgi:2-haloacid dehalogenase